MQAVPQELRTYLQKPYTPGKKQLTQFSIARRLQLLGITAPWIQAPQPFLQLASKRLHAPDGKCPTLAQLDPNEEPQHQDLVAVVLSDTDRRRLCQVCAIAPTTPELLEDFGQAAELIGVLSIVATALLALSKNYEQKLARALDALGHLSDCTPAWTNPVYRDIALSAHTLLDAAARSSAERELPQSQIETEIALAELGFSAASVSLPLTDLTLHADLLAYAGPQKVPDLDAAVRALFLDWAVTRKDNDTSLRAAKLSPTATLNDAISPLTAYDPTLARELAKFTEDLSIREALRLKRAERAVGIHRLPTALTPTEWQAVTGKKVSSTMYPLSEVTQYGNSLVRRLIDHWEGLTDKVIEKQPVPCLVSYTFVAKTPYTRLPVSERFWALWLHCAPITEHMPPTPLEHTSPLRTLKDLFTTTRTDLNTAPRLQARLQSQTPRSPSTKKHGVYALAESRGIAQLLAAEHTKKNYTEQHTIAYTELPPTTSPDGEEAAPIDPTAIAELAYTLYSDAYGNDDAMSSPHVALTTAATLLANA